MPKIYMHFPQGTFTNSALDSLAAEITEAAPAFEQIPNTAYAKSNIWIYACEYPVERVYHGGRSGGTKIVTVEVNAMEGGLDAATKARFIAFLTEAVGRHSGIKPGDRVPVFVLIRDVSAENWGMFGKTVSLEGLRHPPADAVPV